MAIIIACEKCGLRYRLADEHAGRTAKCKCGAVMQVPQQAASSAATPPAASPVDSVSPSLVLAAAELSPQQEKRRRTANLVWVGILLLVAFFLPILVNGVRGVTLVFPNLAVLAGSSASAKTTFLLICPLVLGLAAIVLGLALHTRIRGAILLGLAAIPAVVFLATRGVLGRGSSSSYGSLGGWEGLAVLSALVLLIAACSRWHRPGHGWIYWIGLAGTAIFILSQVLPVGAGSSKQLPVAFLLRHLGQTRKETVQIDLVGTLLAVGLVAAAHLVGLLAIPTVRRHAKKLAATSFWLVVAAAVVVVLSRVGVTCTEPENVGGSMGMSALAALLRELKPFAWMGGTAALLVAGAVDLIVGQALPSQSAEQEGLAPVPGKGNALRVVFGSVVGLAIIAVVILLASNRGPAGNAPGAQSDGGTSGQAIDRETPSAKNESTGQPASAAPSQYPLWDGKEKVTDYARRAQIAAAELTLDLGNNVKMKLVLIPAGTFTMGSSDVEKDRNSNEGPRRTVTITSPYYLGVCEVTQEQFEQVMGRNPSDFKGKQNPVEMVSWEAATDFCARMSQKTGKTVRLPTEAQWEFACRVGTGSRFAFGDDDLYTTLPDYSWHAKNSGETTHPVGQKKPSAWGLFDMHGNVYEWCADWYADSYVGAAARDPQGPQAGAVRVLRGGGWRDVPRDCRSASRNSFDPKTGYFNVGFRVCASSAGPAGPGGATSPEADRSSGERPIYRRAGR